MKRIIILLLITAFAVSACATAESEPEAIPTVVLEGGNEAASNEQVTAVSSGDTVTASAVVVPVQDANLSFTSVGRVTEINVQVGDTVNAGDVLVRLDTSILEARVREAEANLAAAEIQVKYLIRVGTSEQHLEVAQNDVNRAQALLDSSKAVLEAQSYLTAPITGTVISVDISPYETVTPGQVVLVIGDLTNYQIETSDLSERDVTRVKIGQPATVFVEALGDDLTGKVVDIARISSEIGGDVVYKVTVELDDQPAGLLWGMSADVDILVGE